MIPLSEFCILIGVCTVFLVALLVYNKKKPKEE